MLERLAIIFIKDYILLYRTNYTEQKSRMPPPPRSDIRLIWVILSKENIVQTISETTAARNPRGKNVYRTRQTERAGWHPRKGSQRQLAQDIAASIRQHRANGDARWIQPHEFTPNLDTQAIVQQLLAADSQQ